MDQVFPVINHIDDLLLHIKDKPELRVGPQEVNGVTIQVVCYMVNYEETFSNMWARECRGIAFGPDGKVINRPLHKFFNLGERPSTYKENLDWSNVASIMDKRDGSMGSTCMINGKVFAKSKKSFSSDVAIKMTNFINTRKNYIEFCGSVANFNATPIFEYTAPHNRIVIGYKEEELTLLHVRDNVTGEYITHKYLHLADKLGVKCVSQELGLINEDGDCDVEYILENNKSLEQSEGFIALFNDGNMVKMKTPWYCKLHRTVTFVRERDIAQCVLDETLDDVKDSFRELGISMSRIFEIEKAVVEKINDITANVKSLLADRDSNNLSKSDFARKHNKNVYFHLAIVEFDGTREADYIKFYESYHLKQDWTLDAI